MKFFSLLLLSSLLMAHARRLPAQQAGADEETLQFLISEKEDKEFLAKSMRKDLGVVEILKKMQLDPELYLFELDAEQLGQLTAQINLPADEARQVITNLYDLETSAYLTEQTIETFKKAQAIPSEQIEEEETKIADCAPEDAQQCEEENKARLFFRRLGFILGKGAAITTVNTTRPLTAVSGFFRGFFQKPSKDPLTLPLQKFFNTHRKDYKKTHENAGTFSQYKEAFRIQTNKILSAKFHRILNSILKEVGIRGSAILENDGLTISLDEVLFTEEGLKKINADMVNGHPEFAEVLDIVGPVEEAQALNFVKSGVISYLVSQGQDDLDRALTAFSENIYTYVIEGTIDYAAQKLVSPAVLSIVSSTLSAVYTGVTLTTDVATLTSLIICQDKKFKQRFDNKPDLREYCSFIVNKSLFELAKTQNRSYLFGKNLRKKIYERRQEKIRRRAEEGKQPLFGRD